MEAVLNWNYYFYYNYAKSMNTHNRLGPSFKNIFWNFIWITIKISL